MHLDWMGFILDIQRWLNICKSVNMIQNMMDKNHMMILKYTEKAFDKIPHSFTIKTLNKVDTEGLRLNIKKATYDRPTATHTQQWQAESFSLRSVRRQGCPLLQLLFNIVLKVPVTAAGQEIEIKGI